MTLKKILLLFGAICFSLTFAQQSANRFFYELTFKPKKAIETRETIFTVLDITNDKSVYQDFTIISQDSIVQASVEKMQKTGIFEDISKSIKMPKFSYKIYKTYPAMEISVNDAISNKRFFYKSPTKLDWKVANEKKKIGEYTAQKATTHFGGRHWTAWFSSDIPFQDGPYKFHGLPGLIVQLEDDAKEYSWTLKGNKTIKNWEEYSYTDKFQARMGGNLNAMETTKEKFDKAYANFKADPLGEFRPYMTPEMMKQNLPGSNKTIGEMIKEQEKLIKDFFEGIDNPIEK